ncbi:unnamed protein product [Closterium sp. NIES-53]
MRISLSPPGKVAVGDEEEGEGEDQPQCRICLESDAPHWLSHGGRSYLHDLLPFAVWYAAHQLNLWPRVSLPETSPTLRWTGKVGDASVLRVWGSRAFVRDTSADKLSSLAIPCVFFGFTPDATGWQFDHPTSHCVLPSQDVTFDELVPFYHPLPLAMFVEVAVDSGGARGAASGGAASGAAKPASAKPGSAESEGAESGDSGGAGPSGTGAAGASGVGGAGAGDAGAGDLGAGGTCDGDPGAVGAGAGGTRAGGTDSPLPAPSPCAEQTEFLTERREPEFRPASPVRVVRTGRRVPCLRLPPVPGTHIKALRPSSVPLRVPLPSPLASSLPDVPDPESDLACAASPTVPRLLATVLYDPSFESTAASALVAELVDFAAACRLDYATTLVAESESDCPPSVGGECALGTDVLKDMQEDFECLAAAVLLHVAAQRYYELHFLDFSTAFLQGNLHEEIWLRRPPGFTGSFPAGTQWSLERLVYGLRQAPCKWHDTLRMKLAALGFAPSTADPSLFLRTDTSLPPFYVLVSFSASASGIPRHSPLLCLPVSRSQLHLRTSPILARYVAPGRHRPEHWEAAKRVLRYLCSTLGMGLVLGGRGPVVLTGNADASWVDDLATQRLSLGYTFSLGSGSVSWRSTCSSSVLSSNCEAEIYAGAMAEQELRWLTYLLTDLGERPRSLLRASGVGFLSFERLVGSSCVQ